MYRTLINNGCLPSQSSLEIKIAIEEGLVVYMPLNFYKIGRPVHFDAMEWHENELVSNFSKLEWHISN